MRKNSFNQSNHTPRFTFKLVFLQFFQRSLQNFDCLDPIASSNCPLETQNSKKKRVKKWHKRSSNTSIATFLVKLLSISKSGFTNFFFWLRKERREKIKQTRELNSSFWSKGDFQYKFVPYKWHDCSSCSGQIKDEWLENLNTDHNSFKKRPQPNQQLEFSGERRK